MRVRLCINGISSEKQINSFDTKTKAQTNSLKYEIYNIQRVPKFEDNTLRRERCDNFWPAKRNLSW